MGKVMRNTTSKGSRKNNGILKLKLVMERLQKGFFLVKKRSDGQEETVPKDVKEGHFAVIASDDYVERRFVVPIDYLRHPLFLRLLERAAEEYGFNHEGALMIPCTPSELEWMLQQQMGTACSSSSSQDHAAAAPAPAGGTRDWTSCKTKSMVESC